MNINSNMDTQRIYNLELLVKPTAAGTRNVMDCLANHMTLIESLSGYSSMDRTFLLEVICFWRPEQTAALIAEIKKVTGVIEVHCEERCSHELIKQHLKRA